MELITLSTDFEKQSQGVGNMEGVIYSINPNAKVIHLMHGIDAFSITSAARTMETVYFMPVGYHVCVVDPGVGTSRKALIIQTGRGDYLIGPDNGCLMTAPRFLGGIKRVVEIKNEKYMIHPISPIFHGRHVFAPVAAHLSKGVPIAKFGLDVSPASLAQAPYEEAVAEQDKINAVVIHINAMGSLHINVMGAEWDNMNVKSGHDVQLQIQTEHIPANITAKYCTTFADAPIAHAVILKDDYGRVEIALNQGSFAKKYNLKVGAKITISK